MTFIVPESRRRVIVSQRFGKLTTCGVPFYLSTATEVRQHVVVACDCGSHSIVMVGNLLKGLSMSCGCSRITTGLWNTSIAKRWRSMIQRCYDPNHVHYDDYGGRGILVCTEWLNSMDAFFQWATRSGYSDELQIDRIDNNKHYEPENCRWVSASHNCRNRRSSRILTAFGETKTLIEWMEDPRLHVHRSTMHRRLQAGMSLEEAMGPKTKRTVA